MFRVKLSSNLGDAKRCILDPQSTASALLFAVKEMLGVCWHWEPETLWIELARKDCDPPEGNRAKIQAGITLFFVPSFYWDGTVFGKTALAFDGHEANPDMLEEASTAQLAWAVQEAARIVAWHGDQPHDFQHEPKAYAAVVMHREGLVLAPTQLAFAQDLLDETNCKETPEGEECPTEPLKKRVETAWPLVDKTKLETQAFTESPVDVQLARLSSIDLYIQQRTAAAVVTT